MTNLEIMDKATSFTTGAYMNAYYGEVTNGSIDYSTLEDLALDYSTSALVKVLYSEDGMCKDYTRQDNLRYDIASIGADGIKTELLKNVVNVATFHRMNDTIFGNQIGEVIRPDMAPDQVAVVIFNNMVNHGAERGYEMLNDPHTLITACKVFAAHRREGKKEILDHIANTNNGAIYVNNEIDTYYARYGELSKEANNPSYGGK